MKPYLKILASTALVFALVLALLFLATKGLRWKGLSGEELLRRGIERFDMPVGMDSKPMLFSIGPGESAGRIAKDLESQGLVRSAFTFRLLALYYGVDTGLKAGVYELHPSMTATEILSKLYRGTVRSVVVSIPEGWRAEQIADALSEKGIFDRGDFLRVYKEGFDYEFLNGKSANSTLEGFLFPDTYRIPPKFTAGEFIKLMLQNFDARFTPAMRQQAAASGMSIREVITLASIVEREALLAEERPIIASVFLNRLRLGMPLYADPTVQYALASNPGDQSKYGYWKSELTQEDLEVDSPYNTYRRKGLPPGPISNPGLASIKAVLEPAQTDYLYFVSKGDGSHAFARTLDEHNRNVAMYGKN